MTKKKPESKYGKIKIAVNDGRLRLHIPPKLSPDGEVKYVALGLDDTPLNRNSAEAKILELQKDILEGNFDKTLNKYRQSQSLCVKKELTLADIWLEYLKYKQPIVKESHYDYMSNGLGNWIAASPYQSLDEAIYFRQWLLAETTNGMVKRVLTYANAAVEWAIARRRVDLPKSPYAGMAGELPPHDWEIESEPNALTPTEIAAVNEAFATHENLNLNNYALFVNFLFLTGCRPGEAIGLRVKDIPKNRKYVHFNGSLVRVRGKAVRTDGSKNNKKRKFPVNVQLKRLIDEAIWHDNSPDDYVFTSLCGQPIQHSYFDREIWKAVVDRIIGRDSTPYSCRDSFITHQLAAGVSPSTICAWCDTSIEVIQKRYLDPKIAMAVKPIEIAR